MSAAPLGPESGLSTAHSIRPAGPSTNLRSVLARIACAASHPQAFDDAPVFQVLLDDLVDVGAVHVGVPDGVRIDHHARALLAAVEAAGLVDAHLPLPREAELLHALLGVVAHLRSALVVAADLPAVALVAAEEYVPGVVGHGRETGRILPPLLLGFPAPRGQKDERAEPAERPCRAHQPCQALDMQE